MGTRLMLGDVLYSLLFCVQYCLKLMTTVKLQQKLKTGLPQHGFRPRPFFKT